jgi:hypothetical protein
LGTVSLIFEEEKSSLYIRRIYIGEKAAKLISEIHSRPCKVCAQSL